MRFDIFGRYRIDVQRVGERWRVLRIGNGTLADIRDLLIPSDIAADEVEGYLNDLLHEEAIDGRVIRRVETT